MSRKVVGLRSMWAVAAAGVLLLAMSAAAQSLTGRWLATGKALENGEQQKAILELKQDGDQITGNLRGLGFQNDVTGTVKGSHFELFGVGWNDKKPFLVGDLENGKLVGTQWGGEFTARPATDADEFAKEKYIEPPSLHDVPYNGLAKTPPMGWNSWNLFAEKVDDQTVRTMADAMVSSGMRMPATST